MTTGRGGRRAATRTGHVAPDETLDPQTYVVHVAGRQRVLEEAPAPFADVEDAIAWALERAPTVLVRRLDDPVIRWTGDHPLPGAPDMPRWDERPRPGPTSGAC